MNRSSSVVAVVGLIGVSGLLAGCDLHAEGAAAEGRFERTLQVGRAPEVRVDGRSGSIRVAAGAEGNVQVRARIHAYDDVDLFSTYTPAERVTRLESAPPIVQRGNVIAIGDVDDWALVQHVSIDYEITVPPDTRLNTASRSATQTITAIAGPVAAMSRSGSISIESAGGPLRLESRSGDVTIAGEPRGGWEVQTRSGEVELRIPPSAAFDLSVASRSGAIETRRALSLSSRLTGHRLEGRAGTGGPRIDVATRSGSIRVE
jgi:putative adhesin